MDAQPQSAEVTQTSEEVWGEGTSYLEGPHTLSSWLLTRDHKRIGLLFLGTIAIFFAIGGALALSVRLELMSTGQTIVSADTYNQLFTLHGAIMIVLILCYLVHSLLWGEEAGVNPWGAATLEWRSVPTPPLEHNYLRTPVVTRGPYAFEQIDDLFGHDLTGGLSGDGEGGPIPKLATPQEHPDQLASAAEKGERTH